MKRSNLVKNLSGIVFMTFFIVWFVSSCEHAELMQSQGGGFQPGTIDTMAQFSWIQENIFSQKCAVPGCHVQGSAAFDLVLSEGQAYGNLVNVPAQGPQLQIMRVRPGDPDSSYIVWKLENRPGIAGSRMPLGSPDPLPQAEIDAIKRWIQGATFNKRD